MTVPPHSIRDSSGPPTIELAISGMDCANCVRHVTEAIQGVDGVHSAGVNLEARQVVVRWLPGAEAKAPAVIHAIKCWVWSKNH